MKDIYYILVIIIMVVTIVFGLKTRASAQYDRNWDILRHLSEACKLHLVTNDKQDQMLQCTGRLLKTLNAEKKK